MAVKKGYKQTEVGVIPDVWKCARVQELLDSGDIVEHLDGNHGELYPRSHEFTNNGVPYITANDLVDNRVEFSRCKHLSDARAKRFRKGVAKHGDVLFAHNATVGPTAILRTELDFVILSTTVTYYRCRPERLHNAWLLYGLQALVFVAQYRAIMSQSTRNQVPITAQRKLTLVVPPFIEQTAIASALSDADAWIESLEQLIAKKRQIKQGAMQELLTGKRRLPGFSGEWETKRLGEIVDTDSENLGSDTRPDYAFNYISLEDVDKGTLRSFSEQDFQTAPSRARRRLSPDDVLVSTVRPNLLSHLLFTDGGRDWVCSTGFCVVRCRQDITHPYFVFSQMFSDCVKRQIEALLTGSNYPAINSRDVRALLIHIPSYEEQTAIATVLSDMDTEIESLESKLSKARGIKQGMMQELLTGRTRLI